MILSEEFETQKLSYIDINVGKWISTHVPDALEDYVRHLKHDYAMAGIVLSEEKLLREFDLLANETKD